MKKTIYLLLAAILVALFAVSCSPEQKESVTVGGSITRGKIPSNASAAAGEGIKWKVLEVTEGRALVISEKILTTMAHVSGSKSSLDSWANSEINAWLNRTGSDGFISQYGLENVSMAQVGEVNGKVFLLTKTEAGTYFSDDAARVAYDLSGKTNRWWLSTRISNGGYFDSVNGDGVVDTGGTPVNYAYGIRPAFWINL